MNENELKLMERYWHYLNNALMVISGGTEIISLDALTQRGERYLNTIKAEIKELTFKSKNLASLYHEYPNEKTNFNLVMLLSRIVEVLKFGLKRNFKVSYYDDSADEIMIAGNPSLLRDALLNFFLSVNDPMVPVDFALSFLDGQLILKSNYPLKFNYEPNELKIVRDSSDYLLKINFL